MKMENTIYLIKEKLNDAFSPNFLEVIDESHKHVGHAGSQAGKGHYKVKIRADFFADTALVVRHRLIYNALGDVLEKYIHALSIDAK